MNVIWHNHIATYSDVEIAFCVFGKKNDRPKVGFIGIDSNLTTLCRCSHGPAGR
jgi:hypothetical protein